MKSKQFKDARRTLAHSQQSLADEWNMGKNGGRTIRRWESGEIPVNPIAAYCITLMCEGAGLPIISKKEE